LKIIFLIIIVAFLSVCLNTIILNKAVVFSRLASFVQFLMALTFAYLGSMKYFAKYIGGVFWAYLIFTVVYFLSNGLVETILIKSRDSGTSSILALTGRGARTLSPEPSFFANQLFNLMLITLLIIERDLAVIKSNIKILWFILTICLLCTLSGYGFLIVFFISLVFYFRFFIVSAIILLITFPLWISYLEHYSQFRALRLIFRVL